MGQQRSRATDQPYSGPGALKHRQPGVEEGRIVIEAAGKLSGRVKLPFSEADLITGLNAHTAHADELASPSGGELGD